MTRAPAETDGLAERIAELGGRAGQEIGVTAWERFDQASVACYAALVGETHWIHTDAERAARSRFGSTVVQASLLMARFGAWIEACGVWLPEPAVPINYGYDRVRMLSPLRVGEPVRGRVALGRFALSARSVRMDLHVEAERPGGGKPVISAEWIVMFQLEG